jgi:hypothetical protein
LSQDRTQEHRGYSLQIPTSHFLFTEQEIESNSFFILKYSTQCLGSYFVDGSDIKNLDQLLRGYEKVCYIANEITSWPKKIERHQEEIKRDCVQDSVVENFDFQRLTDITYGYGKQAIDTAIEKLEAWHEQHYWKSKKSKSTVYVPQDDAVTN